MHVGHRGIAILNTLARVEPGQKFPGKVSEGWARCSDLGGGDGSDHSAVLRRLRRQGLVERRRRGGQERAAFEYRISAAGRSLLGLSASGPTPG